MVSIAHCFQKVVSAEVTLKRANGSEDKILSRSSYLSTKGVLNGLYLFTIRGLNG